MQIPGDLNCPFALNISSVGLVIGNSGAVSKGQEGCSDLIQQIASAAGKVLLLLVLQTGACSPLLCSDFSSIT